MGRLRRLALVGLVAGASLAQGHPEPPPGVVCSPRGTHQCSCRRLITDRDCEGQPMPDRICRFWCWESHCACPVACVPMKDGTGESHE